MSLILDLLYPRDYYQSLYSSVSVKSIYRFPGFEGVLSLFPYHYPINQLLHDLKYNFVTDLIPDLVELSVKSLHANFPNLVDYWHQQNYCFLPVPLHPYRQNWRGFNQSQLLATALSHKLSLPIYPDLVVRQHYTTPQAKVINRSVRKTHLHQPFILNSALIPENIIIFDDVITSGSTVTSLASILPQTCHLWALSIAG